MKICPICHTEYDDTKNFCIKDGSQLIDAPSGGVNTGGGDGGSEVSGGTPPPVKRKGGCFKKIVIGLIILVIAFIGFYHYAMNAATYLRVEPNQLVANKGGGEIKVGIDYDGYVWMINHAPDWVNIDEEENDFIVRAEKNETGSTRQGTITVQSGKQLAQVAIVQKGSATFIKGDKSSLHFPREGGKQKIALETDGCELHWKCTNFIDPTLDNNNSITIEVPSNGGNYRTGEVVVNEDNVSYTIQVTQSGACPDCNGTGERTCNYCMGTGTVGFGMFANTCPACGGSGKVNCSSCGGTGERD